MALKEIDFEKVADTYDQSTKISKFQPHLGHVEMLRALVRELDMRYAPRTDAVDHDRTEADAQAAMIDRLLDAQAAMIDRLLEDRALLEARVQEARRVTDELARRLTPPGE